MLAVSVTIITCCVFFSGESFITKHLFMSFGHPCTVFILNSSIRLLILYARVFWNDNMATLSMCPSNYSDFTGHVTEIFTQRALAPDRYFTFMCYIAYFNVNVGRPGDMCCPGPVWFFPHYGFQRHYVCGVGCKSPRDKQQLRCSHDPTTSADTVWSWQGRDLCWYYDRTGHGCLWVPGECRCHPSLR
jgi:hypothetical protein